MEVCVTRKVMRMNISSISPSIPSAIDSTLASDAVVRQAATEVLSMNLDQMDVAGDTMVKMMENSVTPHIGSNFDVSI